MSMEEGIKTIELCKGARLIAMSTGVENLVSFHLSILAGTRFTQINQDLASITAQMLLEGTKSLNKEEFHKALESAGIVLNIKTDTTRVNISATLLAEQATTFIDLLSQMLKEPLFDAKQFETLRTRMIASIKQGDNDTRARAMQAILTRLYPPDHPNYQSPSSDRINALNDLQVGTVHHFFENAYGLGGVCVAIAGDIDINRWVRLLKEMFTNWPTTNIKISPDIRTLGGRQEMMHTELKDKASSDVFVASSMVLDIRSLDYYAFKLATHVLGGDFVARLMKEVREKRGMTYGIYATLWSVAEGDSGLFYIWGTFAPEILPKALPVINNILASWISKGITKEEFTRAKQAIVGNYKVGLADSRGVVSLLAYIIENDLPASYADDYPKVIEALSLSQVNKAIKTYVSLSKVITSTSGITDKAV